MGVDTIIKNCNVQRKAFGDRELEDLYQARDPLSNG